MCYSVDNVDNFVDNFQPTENYIKQKTLQLIRIIYAIYLIFVLAVSITSNLYID